MFLPRFSQKLFELLITLEVQVHRVTITSCSCSAAPADGRQRVRTIRCDSFKGTNPIRLFLESRSLIEVGLFCLLKFRHTLHISAPGGPI